MEKFTQVQQQESKKETGPESFELHTSDAIEPSQNMEKSGVVRIEEELPSTSCSAPIPAALTNALEANSEKTDDLQRHFFIPNYNGAVLVDSQTLRELHQLVLSVKHHANSGSIIYGPTDYGIIGKIAGIAVEQQIAFQLIDYAEMTGQNWTEVERKSHIDRCLESVRAKPNKTVLVVTDIHRYFEAPVSHSMLAKTLIGGLIGISKKTLTIYTTNNMNKIDTTFMYAANIAANYFFDIPVCSSGRRDILASLLKHNNLILSEDISLNALAENTDQFTGRDLTQYLYVAYIAAQSADNDRNVGIDQMHFERSFEEVSRIKKMKDTEKRSSVSSVIRSMRTCEQFNWKALLFWLVFVIAFTSFGIIIHLIWISTQPKDDVDRYNSGKNHTAFLMP